MSWRSAGKKVIKMLDANEDICTDATGEMLMDETGKGLQETILASTGSRLTATHFCGTWPIDAIWASKDEEIVGAGAMPVGYGIGDNHLFVAGFTMRSLAWEEPQPIWHPKAQCPNNKIPHAKKIIATIVVSSSSVIDSSISLLHHTHLICSKSVFGLL